MTQQLTDFRVERYEESSDARASLDLFSTSPTLFPDLCAFHRCAYNAPFFAVARAGKRFRVVQGCCNHWNCPRCGIQVARAHYGRIVAGAREIAQNQQLYFVTVTCRGKEVSVDEAKSHYLEWTSRFLDACYTRSKRADVDWYYVQVTELQKRGHPHSHILTTFCPTDVIDGFKDDWKRGRNGLLECRKVKCLRSDWMREQVVKSGLGEQYDISKVRTVEAASRYVAKYMFKKSQFNADFPARWKRVRYSQSWPKLEKPKADAFVLLSREDWKSLADRAVVVDAETGDAYESASYFLRSADVIINETKTREVWHRDNANE
jgi:hypothetical protein